MKVRLLKDVTICGVTSKKGFMFNVVPPDRIHGDTIEWCYGHGDYWPLKVGVDIELILEKNVCPMCKKPL